MDVGISQDLLQTSSVTPPPVMQHPTVPLTTHKNEWSAYKIDLEIVQHKGDTTNIPPKPDIKNDVPLQPNIMTMTQSMNNLMDTNSVMSHSNVMGQIKNNPNMIDETKQQQQQNTSIPQVQMHYNEDLSVLEEGSTDVDVNNGQYYNVNSYVRPVPTAPTLEAIYGSSVPQTNT